MVIAGELNEADRNVLSVMQLIENQKLLVTRQHKAVRGKANTLLAMHICDFAFKFSFVSSRSLSIPLSKFETRPPTASEAAFSIEYYVLYAG